MGSRKPTPTTRPHASSKRLRPRACLRKGCARRFQPACWNQRYCQDPQCLREVRRWQAARRQRQCRQQPRARQKHAVAERNRRAARREKRPNPPETAPSHAGAWSRSKPSPAGPLCHRPGCYDPPRDVPRGRTRYCSQRCQQELRRVWDRERKYLARNRPHVQALRRLEYQATQLKRRTQAKRLFSNPAPSLQSLSPPARLTAAARSPDIATAARQRYPPARSGEVSDHDSKTDSGPATDTPHPA